MLHQEDLWGEGNGESPRFTFLIVDHAGDGQTNTLPCAVVLIPRGRDRDFTFSSLEGLQQARYYHHKGKVQSRFDAGTRGKATEPLRRPEHELTTLPLYLSILLYVIVVQGYGLEKQDLYSTVLEWIMLASPVFAAPDDILILRDLKMNMTRTRSKSSPRCLASLTYRIDVSTPGSVGGAHRRSPTARMPAASSPSV